jgi:hypothetical protein
LRGILRFDEIDDALGDAAPGLATVAQVADQPGIVASQPTKPGRRHVRSPQKLFHLASDMHLSGLYFLLPSRYKFMICSKFQLV